jgi:hypothetical protein
MRENKKAFTEVPVITLPGYTGVPADRRFFYMDSVIQTATDTGKTKWYTTGQGDCFASFKYRLYTDKYQPVLLLKEWNYWGGCRAGGSKDYTLTFSMPVGIRYTFKNTILVEKYSHDD